MKKTRLIAALSFAATAALVGATHHLSHASDHDDGETDLKSRALNLSDHFAFKSPAKANTLSLVMYFNPRSLPDRQYYLSTNARYELHVSKVASRSTAPTGTDDYLFRFEAGPPNMAGTQPITLTVLKDGQVIGTHTGASTGFAQSKANTVTTNTATIDGAEMTYFVGQRSDSFHFDVVRYFQVRAFLADRFFGGAGGNGNPAASLAPNCRGDAFLKGILNPGTDTDADAINLWNPPTCAPDFTKGLNVTAIVLDVPVASLGGGAVFDTWSTISVKQ